jgi:hypothetical protein
MYQKIAGFSCLTIHVLQCVFISTIALTLSSCREDTAEFSSYRETSDKSKTRVASDQLAAKAESKSIQDIDNKESVDTFYDAVSKIEDVVETTVSLGIHLEDAADNDFNDLVICIKGKFSYSANTGTIVSLEEQINEALINRLSANQINVVGSLLHPDGSTEQIFDLTPKFDQAEKVTIHWMDGTKLAVDYKVGNLRKAYDLSTPNKIKFEADKCRTTGI